MYSSLTSLSEHPVSSRVSLSTKSRTSTFFLPSVRSSIRDNKSKTILLTSKNFFTTTLREETEEIIEDDISTPVHTSLTRDLSSKMPKTLPELNRPNSTFKSELSEENTQRGNRALHYLTEFKSLMKDQEHHLDTNGVYRERRSNINLRDRLLRLCENVLNVYNIQLKIAEMTSQDSLMKVEKVKDRFILARYLELIIQEMCKFPYSFFKKLGLSVLTFCQDYELYKEPNNPMVSKKVFGGMFAINKLGNEENVVNQFYKILFYHLKTQLPDLDSQWSKVYIRTSKTIMHISMNMIVTQSTKPKKNFFEEQCRLFKEVILAPNNVLKHESNMVRMKAYKLKNSMEGIDPDGITEAWWKKRGLNLIVGSLDHIRE